MIKKFEFKDLHNGQIFKYGATRYQKISNEVNGRNAIEVPFPTNFSPETEVEVEQ
jgi:hypothetical protein